MDTKKIGVLLSTYNGEKYLKEQLDSLVGQTYNNFTIFIRDDNSSDETKNIIAAYTNQYKEKIKLIDFEKTKNLGVRLSFERLMKTADSCDYFSFCDQDDIWELDKLSILAKNINKLESIYGKDTPLLIFSNMTIFDESKVLIPSYLKYAALKRYNFINGMFRGVVAGCQMFFNKSALKTYFSSDRCFLHDHNMIMSVYINGRIDFIDNCLIHHRIHSNNFYGMNIKKISKYDFYDLLKYFFQSKKYRDIMLNEYYTFNDIFINNTNKDLCFQKELYTKKEVNELSYFKRKFWYLKHFKPMGENRLSGIIKLILI